MSKKSKKTKKTKTINANRLAKGDVIKFGGNDYLVLDASTSLMRANSTSIFAAPFAKTPPNGVRFRIGDLGTMSLYVPDDTPFTVLK